MADNIWTCSSYTSHIIGDAENSVPLYVDIPQIGGRGSRLLFEVFLQKYLQFLCEYFLFNLFLFGGSSYKLCPWDSTKREKSCWPNMTDDNSVHKDIRGSLLCAVWAVADPAKTNHTFCLFCTFWEELPVHIFGN